MKNNTHLITVGILILLLLPFQAWGQEQNTQESVEPMPETEATQPSPQPKKRLEGEESADLLDQTIFDDKLLLEGYTEKYKSEPREVLLAMVKDETLNPIKMAAAVRVLKDYHSHEIFSREKIIITKILLRRLNRTDSPFVEIEIRHTLCRMDRYKFFKSMVPALILKLEHYNTTVNELAFHALQDIIGERNTRAREARIVFNTLRKMLFLSRRRLAKINEPSEKLKRKLILLRWSIKVLGKQELRRLPKEVINLL